MNQVGEAVVGDAIENLKNAVVEAVDSAGASLGTLWVNVGTPDLTRSSRVDTTADPQQAVSGVLSYVMWIGLSLAVIVLVIVGARMAALARSGEGTRSVGRIGVVLVAVVLISGAGLLVGGILPAGPRGSMSPTVEFLQGHLWFYMGAAAVVSVIIGAIKMAWEQRAEHGREIVKSLLTLIVVAGAGVTIISLLVAAADSFSVSLINDSLACSVTDANSPCFADNMTQLLGITATSGPVAGQGALMVILLGLVAVLASIFQIMLMVARGGMLVILTGIFPLAAAFTNTEMGKTWFKRCISWLTAFILYKPAAAIIYATAFQLVGTDVYTDDGSGLIQILTGLMLMIIALVALPALMKFVAPMVGAMTGPGGGGGAGIAGAAMAALPTGAAALGKITSSASAHSVRHSSSSTRASKPMGPEGSINPTTGAQQQRGSSQQMRQQQGSSGNSSPGARSGPHFPGAPGSPSGSEAPVKSPTAPIEGDGPDGSR